MTMQTFNLTPLHSWEAATSHRVNVTSFESGAEQRAYMGPVPRQWVLSFAGTVTFMNQLRAFYDARKGPFEAFLWTPPGAVSPLTVRFSEDSLSFKNEGLGYGSCQLTLMEVL